jgi:hypothetical protein
MMKHNSGLDLSLNLKLQINKEYQDLVTPLGLEDYNNLKNSIRDNGQYMPVIINPDGVILDGYH